MRYREDTIDRISKESKKKSFYLRKDEYVIIELKRQTLPEFHFLYMAYRQRKRKRRHRDYSLNAKSRASRAVALSKAARPRRQFIVTANPRTGGFNDLEVKYLDTTMATTTISNNTWSGGEYDPAANCLNAPTQGTGESNREGRRIRINKIQLRGRINRPLAQDQNDCRNSGVVRVAIVLDTQTNGAQLNAEEVYDDDAGEAGDDIYGFRNLEYTRRYKVLWSDIYTMHDICAFPDGANTASIVGNCHIIDVHLPCNIVTEFKANAGSVADIVDNSIHVIACSTHVSADTLEYVARVRFVG
jgi:hypothetical protein